MLAAEPARALRLSEVRLRDGGLGHRLTFSSTSFVPLAACFPHANPLRSLCVEGSLFDIALALRTARQWVCPQDSARIQWKAYDYKKNLFCPCALVALNCKRVPCLGRQQGNRATPGAGAGPAGPDVANAAVIRRAHGRDESSGRTEYRHRQ